MYHAGGADRAGVAFVFSEGCGIQCLRSGERRDTELDRTGRRLLLGRSLPNLWVCRVSAASVVFGAGMALVPQPGRGVTDSDARGVRVAVALAAHPSFLVACLGRAWRDPGRRGVGGAPLRRTAQRVQPFGGKSFGRGAAGNGIVPDHALFFFRGTSLGEQPPLSDRSGREAGHFAEGASALACLARRARATADAPARRRVPPV